MRAAGGRLALALVWAVSVTALVVALEVARHIEYPAIRHRTEIMIGVLAAVALLAHLRVRPIAVAGGLAASLIRALVVCVVAVDGTVTALVLLDTPPIRSAEDVPDTGDATVVLVAWAVMLALFVLAAVRATARAAAVPPTLLSATACCGFGATGAWLVMALAVPRVATTMVPALFAAVGAGGLAAAVAERLSRRTRLPGAERPAVAALLAATITSLTIAVAVDGLLPLMHAYARNSAPPWTPGARLIDPVGLLLVGALLAVLTAVASRRPAPASAPASAAVPVA